MKNISNTIFLVGLIIFLSTCIDESGVRNQKLAFFDLKGYFEKQLEILPQNTSVYKITSVNGNRIEKKIDSIDFSQELKVFEESDINKVAWIDKYEVDSIFDDKGSLYQIVYQSTDEKLKTQRLSISFDQNTIDSIEIFNNASGSVAKLEQHLQYIPSFGYSIESKQKTTFSDEHVLMVEVRFEK